MKSSVSCDKAALSRRHFLKLVSVAGAGLTLGVSLPSAIADTVSVPGKTSAEGVSDQMAAVLEPNAFVRINADNSIDVTIKHLEMGQGTFTGLATLIAEELDADWSQIKAHSAPANSAQFNNLMWGPVQGTGGSTAIANSFMQMRNAGAAAKMMLMAAAAQLWEVPIESISVAQGVVHHSQSKRSASFGELAELAAKQAVPEIEEITLKDPKDFVLIGKNIPRKDTGKTDGSAIFTQDVQLPDMLTALVAHSPRFGGTVASFDATRAKKLSGVVDVVQIPTGVAVLAKDFWSAKQAREQLQIVWDNKKASTASSDALIEEYKQLAQKPGMLAKQTGDTKTAFQAAAKVIEASYEFPYLAHAAMEPLNCVVHFKGDSAELWYGAQIHTMDQGGVAAVLGLKPDQVTINTLYAGGSFGRRGNPKSDYVLEAAQIAKAKPNVPIKLVWTREDDTRAGYFRPLYYHHLKAALDKDNNITAWQHRIIGQSIAKGSAFEGMMVQKGVDVTSVEGAANLPYSIPNISVELHTTDPGVPVQWWRSVGSTHTAYSTETFLDEIAAAVDIDPVALRLKLLKEHPRHQGVLQLAADKADWKKAPAKGVTRGIAVHESFNSYVAEVAEVSLKEDGQYKVERVVCAVDCGIAVNPDVIKAQMEGSIGFGLSPTISSEITLENGAVKESNFHDYQVLRIHQMPDIKVHIVPSAENPTGVGEPATPVIAPAVANALAAATGKRYYSLPIKKA